MAENPYPDARACSCPRLLGHIMHRYPCDKAGEIEPVVKEQRDA